MFWPTRNVSNLQREREIGRQRGKSFVDFALVDLADTIIDKASHLSTTQIVEVVDGG